MKELENDNALLREKIESLYSSSVSIYILLSYIFCLKTTLYSPSETSIHQLGKLVMENFFPISVDFRSDLIPLLFPVEHSRTERRECYTSRKNPKFGGISSKFINLCQLSSLNYLRLFCVGDKLKSLATCSVTILKPIVATNGETGFFYLRVENGRLSP